MPRLPDRDTLSTTGSCHLPPGATLCAMSAVWYKGQYLPEQAQWVLENEDTCLKGKRTLGCIRRSLAAGLDSAAAATATACVGSAEAATARGASRA